MSKNVKDMTGMKFNKLLVISRCENNDKHNNALWNCKCDCGKEIVVVGSNLRNGHTKSCGCIRNSKTIQGHSKERIYIIWQGMKNRCYNPSNDNYKWYGEKGIRICDEWKDNFISFREWALVNGYNDSLTIDRIDVNGNYEPNNCRWVDMKKQQNNRSSNRHIEYNDKKYTISQFAELLNVTYWTIINQLKLGWSINRIVEESKNDRKQN